MINLDTIKIWLLRTGGKYIILNYQGQPELIIMSPEEYDRMVNQQSEEKINQELANQVPEPIIEEEVLP